MVAVRCSSSFTDIYRSDATIKDLLRDDSFAVVVHHLSREGTQERFRIRDGYIKGVRSI